MKRIFLTPLFAVLTVLFAGSTINAQNEWLTDYEKSNFLKTPRMDAVISFCQKLDKAFGQVAYVSLGKSPQQRDIPMLVYDADGNFQPNPKSGKLVLLIEACIHPGESEGKDAGLMLLRDIAVNGKFKELLKDITILFVPVFNVDGHERFGPFNRINQNGPEEMGWRTTAANLNLNRDFLKADAPEMRIWLKMFHSWNPDFFVDIHTTDGADYQYPLTYDLNLGGNMDAGLTAWTKNVYLSQIEKKMEADDMPIFPYVSFRNWHDPKSGLISWVCPLMLSEGYGAAANCPSLLIETHMLKDYKTRVSAAYAMLQHSIEIMANEKTRLKTLRTTADSIAASGYFSKNYFPFDWDSSPDSVIVDFRGISYKAVKSEITGSDYFVYGTEKEDMKLEYFVNQVVTDSVLLPAAYIVPAEWTDVIERLKLHGLTLYSLKKEIALNVITTRFADVKLRNGTYEGRTKLESFESEEVTEKVLFPQGSIVIPTAQPKVRIVANALEVKSRDSFFQWGFFNTIFEQKEYAESYVMEKMAKEMLEKDAGLKAKFEEAKKNDPDFIKNPRAVLNWFYAHSPYWDLKKDLYPVAKLDNAELKLIMPSLR
ncbi:MAG: M14 family metallopeptidase [Bacteroidetes bacterium]|nr:M14 family metallopeptidase [Bacteroidota bacterium]MBU1719837.1 M14 family metallopeptidase [Bacteroidota bacterium]